MTRAYLDYQQRQQQRRAAMPWAAAFGCSFLTKSNRQRRAQMSADIGTAVLTGVLPLLGVLVGSGSTIFIQRSSARESRIQLAAQRRQAERAEVKSALASYLEVAQHLQTQLYAREHGRDVPDIPVMVEQIWLAHAQVDVLCSDGLRRPLVEHADALNDVARHEDQHSDWWEYVSPFKDALINAIRAELERHDD